MNELENLKQQAQEMLARITALEAAGKELVWSKVGDEYWIVRNSGGVHSRTWANDRIDKGCLAIGNIFHTQQEAEKELEARKVIAELRRCKGARKFAIGARNHCVFVRLDKQIVDVNVWGSRLNSFGQAYFSTEEHAKAAIKTVGEDRIVAAAKWLAMGE